MAEGILKTMVSDQHAEIRSAGTAAIAGLPASPNAIKIAGDHGANLINHLTRPLDRELIEWADLVLAMEFRQYETILELAPNAVSKTFLLKEYKRKPKYNEIPDPVGKDLFAYHETAMEMLPSLKLIAGDIEKRFK
jgi:protein-tyrosine phosphatase